MNPISYQYCRKGGAHEPCHCHLCLRRSMGIGNCRRQHCLRLYGGISVLLMDLFCFSLHYFVVVLLWPPYVIGQAIIFLPCGFYLSFFLLLSFFSSPNLSGRRLDVYHTSTPGVALVRIYNAGLKCAACCLLEISDTNNRHFGTIVQLCRAISSELRHVSTIGKKHVKQQYLLHMS